MGAVDQEQRREAGVNDSAIPNTPRRIILFSRS